MGNLLEKMKKAAKKSQKKEQTKDDNQHASVNFYYEGMTDDGEGPWRCKWCNRLFYNPNDHTHVREVFLMDEGKKVVPHNAPKPYPKEDNPPFYYKQN